MKQPTLQRGDHINWNHVFYFSKIAARSSIKDAAEKLGMSPSTLSEHLSQLEGDLGVKLFQRQPRKLTLTPEGARLFHYAKQMFETGKRFIDVLSPTPLGCYPVSVGLVPGSSYALAYQIIKSYIAAHRGISVNILRCQHDELETALLEAKLDFGFTDRKSERKNIVQSTVHASEIHFFASAKLEHHSLRDLLRDLPLIICRSDRRVPTAIEEVLESLDIVPSSIIASEYPSLLESLCREGMGVAAIGRLHFENDDSVRRLRLPNDFPALTEKLYATWVTDGENSEAVKHLKPLLNPTPS